MDFTHIDEDPVSRVATLARAPMGPIVAVIDRHGASIDSADVEQRKLLIVRVVSKCNRENATKSCKIYYIW
jgi:hypothetical protein